MNDNITELEQELRDLLPTQPPEGFVDGISEALGDQGNLAVINRNPGKSPKTLTFPTLVNWGMAAATALLAGAIGASLYLEKQASQKLANTNVNETPTATPVAGAPAVPTQLTGTPVNWQPTGSKSILVDVQEEGVVLNPEQTPAQLIRYKYLDTTTYSGPDPQSSMRMAVPREHVVQVKLEAY